MHRVIASRTGAHADEIKDLEEKTGSRGKKSTGLTTGRSIQIPIGDGSPAGGSGAGGRRRGRGRRGLAGGGRRREAAPEVEVGGGGGERRWRRGGGGRWRRRRPAGGEAAAVRARCGDAHGIWRRSCGLGRRQSLGRGGRPRAWRALAVGGEVGSAQDTWRARIGRRRWADTSAPSGRVRRRRRRYFLGFRGGDPRFSRRGL